MTGPCREKGPMLQFQCPHCAETLEAQDDYRGVAGNCNKCGGLVTVPEQSQNGAAKPRQIGGFKAAPGNATMPIARDIEALHSTLKAMIQMYLKRGEREPLAMSLALQASHQMIAIAPYVKWHLDKTYKRPLPDHLGFETIAGILEDQGQFNKARKICLNAKYQGWAGDWDTRINRCMAHIEKEQQET